MTILHKTPADNLAKLQQMACHNHGAKATTGGDNEFDNLQGP